MIKIKNKLFIILWLLSLGFAVQAQDFYVSTSFHEPATDGLRFIYSRDAVHWDSIPGTFLAPKVGKQKVMRDPSIIRTPDGVFHLVWTSSWRGDRGFGYAESRDLMHWSEPKFIEVMDDPTTVNVWAPEFFWDEDRQQAMVVWVSCVPSQHFALGIEDEKNNHRLYYSVTKDFKTWTKGKLLIDPGFSCIDATLLKRGKNDYVMVLKDNTRNARNIKVAFAKNPMDPLARDQARGPRRLCAHRPDGQGARQPARHLWLVRHHARGQKAHASQEVLDSCRQGRLTFRRTGRA